MVTVVYLREYRIDDFRMVEERTKRFASMSAARRFMRGIAKPKKARDAAGNKVRDGRPTLAH